MTPMIFLATGLDVIRSVDECQTWATALPVPGDGGYDPVREQAVLLPFVGDIRRSRYGFAWTSLSSVDFASPALPAELDIVNDGHYVVSADLNVADATATPAPNMAISADGGLTWTYSNPGPYCRISFGASYADGYYYTAQDFAGATPPPPSGPTASYGFYRSVDGVAWVRRTNPTIPATKPNGTTLASAYLQSTSGVAASPVTGALITLLYLQGGGSGGFIGTLLMRSMDGMATWTPLFPPDGTGDAVITELLGLPSGRWIGVIYADWDFSTVTPGAVDLYYSDDDGDTWTPATHPAVTLGEFSVQFLRVGHDGSLYGVFGDFTSDVRVWRSADGAVWTELGRGASSYVSDLFTMPGDARGIDLGARLSTAHFVPIA